MCIKVCACVCIRARVRAYECVFDILISGGAYQRAELPASNMQGGATPSPPPRRSRADLGREQTLSAPSSRPRSPPTLEGGSAQPLTQILLQPYFPGGSQGGGGGEGAIREPPVRRSRTGLGGEEALTQSPSVLAPYPAFLSTEAYGAQNAIREPPPRRSRTGSGGKEARKTEGESVHTPRAQYDAERARRARERRLQFLAENSSLLGNLQSEVKEPSSKQSRLPPPSPASVSGGAFTDSSAKLVSDASTVPNFRSVLEPDADESFSPPPRVRRSVTSIISSNLSLGVQV